MDICVALKNILVANGVGLWQPTDAQAKTNYDIVIGRLAAEHDKSISITETGGLTPNPKWSIDYPSIQVIVRGSPNGYLDARGKAKRIKGVLLGIPSQDIEDDRLTSVNMIGDVATLGYDDANRPLFAINFQLIVEPSTLNTNRQSL